LKVKISQIKLKLSIKTKIAMKILLKCTLFSVLMVTSLASCSDDDGDSSTQEGAEFAGTWVLTEVNLSAAIDTNDDGTTSNNLLNETDCLQDTLILDETFEWDSTEVVANFITQITGNLYNVNCSDIRNQNGNWGVSGTNLFLIGSVNRTFLINGDQLIENLGQDLPGIRTMVYTRQ
jgi:hypothetical protein